MITISLDMDGVTDAFDALVRGLQNTTPLMQEVAFVMNDAVAENFAQGGRPTWLGKATGQPSKLQDTGRLRNSIVRTHDATSAQVGTNVIYAAIHQFGGKTRAHVIRAKNAKALRFGGRFAKRVNHPGSKIPARPFLMLAEEDNVEIERVAQKYLQKLVE